MIIRNFERYNDQFPDLLDYEEFRDFLDEISIISNMNPDETLPWEKSDRKFRYEALVESMAR
jgi:hypothetical protein